MFSRSLSLSIVLASFLLLATASPHARHGTYNDHRHRAAAAMHANAEPANDGKLVPREVVSPPHRRAARRCAAKPPSSPSPSTSSPYVPPAGVAAKPTPSKTLSSSSSSSSSSAPPSPSSPSHNPSKVILGAGKPADWPTKTQGGPTYSATAASPADPYLRSVSDALNNKENPLFTEEHTGDLTYYGQGLGACGDTYDDSTYTAAISHVLYDAWPGATEETNRNAICGPYSPGRQVLGLSGLFQSAVESHVGSILIGGDGLPNCDSNPSVMCHIPLTATITNPNNGKSVIVQIVDRCAGCQGDADIDVTPTVFAAIADPALGRVPGIKWRFNQY
ncbi:hypothetical protein BS47DRAFT_1335299 [Hydnum rufescens UP504]|uniref:RlpA-like protein double-psi beta-barrel domain-containing protein n=1 Tax=Hydnum rufescens UP504 TaxID=1448309 RepID=A0A9P6E2T1_9AGAM|nr:hypothetical protein BS47DRAFT_1335299 [Hydnum rufescens UP504]